MEETTSSQTPGFKAVTEPVRNLKVNIQTRLHQIRLPNLHPGFSESNKSRTFFSQMADELPYSTATEQPLVALDVPKGAYIEEEIDKLTQSEDLDERNVSSASFGRGNFYKYKVTVSIPRQYESGGKNSSDRLRVILSIAEDPTTKRPNRERFLMTNRKFQTHDSTTAEIPIFKLLPTQPNHSQENDGIWTSDENDFNIAFHKTREKPRKGKKYWFIPRHELEIASGDSWPVKDSAFNKKIVYEKKHAGSKLKNSKGSDSFKSQDVRFNSSVKFKKYPVGNKLRTNKHAVLKMNPTVLDLFIKNSVKDSKENCLDQPARISLNSWPNSMLPEDEEDVPEHVTETEIPTSAQTPKQKFQKQRVFGPRFWSKTPHLKPQHFELEGVDQRGQKIRIVNDAFPVIITMQNSSNDNFAASLVGSSKIKDDGDTTYSVPISVIIDRVPLSEVLRSEQLSSSHLDNISSPEMMKKSVEHWNSMIENLETVSDMFNENFTNPCSIVCNPQNCSIMPCLRVLQLMPQVYNSLFQNGQEKNDNSKQHHSSNLKFYNNGLNSSLLGTTKNLKQFQAQKANTGLEPNELFLEGKILKSVDRNREISDSNKNSQLIKAPEGGNVPDSSVLIGRDHIFESKARCKELPDYTTNRQLFKAPEGANASEPSGLIGRGHIIESKARCKELPDYTKNTPLVKVPVASSTTEPSALISEGNILQSETDNKDVERVINNTSRFGTAGMTTPDTSLMLEPAPIYLPLANEFPNDSRKTIYQPTQNQLKNVPFVDQNIETGLTNRSLFGAYINEVNPALFSLPQPARNSFPKVELTMQNTVGNGPNFKQKVVPFDPFQNLNKINDGKKPPSPAYSMDSRSKDYMDDFDDAIAKLESSSVATSVVSTCYPPAWFGSTSLTFSPLILQNSEGKNPSERLLAENQLRYPAVDTNQNQRNSDIKNPSQELPAENLLIHPAVDIDQNQKHSDVQNPSQGLPTENFFSYQTVDQNQIQGNSDFKNPSQGMPAENPMQYPAVDTNQNQGSSGVKNSSQRLLAESPLTYPAVDTNPNQGNSDIKNPSQRMPAENPLRYPAVDQNQEDCTQRATFQSSNNVPFFSRLPWEAKQQNVQNKDQSPGGLKVPYSSSCSPLSTPSNQQPLPKLQYTYPGNTDFRQNVQNKDLLTGGFKAPQHSSCSPLPSPTSPQSLPSLHFTCPDNADLSKNTSVLFTNKIIVSTNAPSIDHPKEQKVKVEDDVSELILWMPENIPKINFVFKQKQQKPMSDDPNKPNLKHSADPNKMNLKRSARSYDHRYEIPHSLDLKSELLSNQNNLLMKEASENKLADSERNIHFLTDEEQLIDTETVPLLENGLMGLSSLVEDNVFSTGVSDDTAEDSHSHHFSLRHSASHKNNSRGHKRHGKKHRRHHRISKKKSKTNETDGQQNDQRKEHSFQSQRDGQKVASYFENLSTEIPLIVNLEEPSKVKEEEDKNEKPRHHKKHHKKHFKKHLRRLHLGSKNESILMDKKQNTTTNDRLDIISELWQKNLPKGKRLMEYFKNLKSSSMSGKIAQHAEKVAENSTVAQKTDWIRNETSSKHSVEEHKKTTSSVRFLENTTFLFDEDEVMNMKSNAFIKNDIKSNLKSKTKNKNLVEVPLDKNSAEADVKETSKKSFNKLFEDSLRRKNDSGSNYTNPNSKKIRGENVRADFEDLKAGTYMNDQLGGKNIFGSAALSSANITDDRSDEKSMPLCSSDPSKNSTEALKIDDPNFESTSSGTFQLLKRFMKGRIDSRDKILGNTSNLDMKTEQTFNNAREPSNANVKNIFVENKDKKEVKESMSKSVAKGTNVHVDKSKIRDQTTQSTTIIIARGLESSTDMDAKMKNKNFFNNFSSGSNDNERDDHESQQEKQSNINMNSTKKHLFPSLHFFKSLSGSNGVSKDIKNKNRESKKNHRGQKKICVHVHGAPPLKLDNTKVYHAVKVPSAVLTPYVAEAISGIHVPRVTSDTSTLSRENNDQGNQMKETPVQSEDEETLCLNQQENENASGRVDEETIQPIEDKNFGEGICLDKKLTDSQVGGNSKTWIHEKKEKVFQNNLMGSGNFIDAKIYPFFPYKVPDLYAMPFSKGSDNNEENFILPLDANRQSSQPTERNKFTCKNYNTPFDEATNIYIYPEVKMKNQDSAAAQLKKYDRQLLEKIRQLGLTDSPLAVPIEKEPELTTLSAAGDNAVKQFIALLNKEKDQEYIQQLIKSIDNKPSAEETINNLQKKSQAHRQLEEILRKSEKEKENWKELKKSYLNSLMNQLTSHMTYTRTTPSTFDKRTTMSSTTQLYKIERVSPHIRICSPEWKNSTYAEVCTNIPIYDKRLELGLKQSCSEARTTPTFLSDKIAAVSDPNPSVTKSNRFSEPPIRENLSAKNLSANIILKEEYNATTASPPFTLKTLRNTAVTESLLQSGDRKTQTNGNTTASSTPWSTFTGEQPSFNISKLIADLRYSRGKFVTERPSNLTLPSGILSKKEMETEGFNTTERVICLKIKSVTEASQGMDRTINETVRGEFTSPRSSSTPDCESLIEGGLWAMANATSILDKLRKLQMNRTHHDKLKAPDQNSEAAQVYTGQRQDNQTYSMTESLLPEATPSTGLNSVSSTTQFNIDSEHASKKWKHTVPENKEKHLQRSASDDELCLSRENIEKKLNALRIGYADGKNMNASNGNEKATKFEDTKPTEFPPINLNEKKDSVMKNESLKTTGLNLETVDADEHNKDIADGFETPIPKEVTGSYINSSTSSKEQWFTIAADMLEENGSENSPLKKSEYVTTTKTADANYHNADAKNSNQQNCGKTINDIMKTGELMRKLNIKTNVMTNSTMSKEMQEETQQPETVKKPYSNRLYFTTEGVNLSSLYNTFTSGVSVSKLVDRTQKNDHHDATPENFATDKIQLYTSMNFFSSTLIPSRAEVATKSTDKKTNFKIVETAKAPATSVMDRKPKNEAILSPQQISDNKMHTYQPEEGSSKNSSTNPDFLASLDSRETKTERKIAEKSIIKPATVTPSTAEQFLEKLNKNGEGNGRASSDLKNSSSNPEMFKDSKTIAHDLPIVFKSVYKRIDNSGSSTMKMALSDKSISVRVKVCQTPPGTTIRCSTVKYNSGEINATKDGNEGKGTESKEGCSIITSNLSLKPLDRGDHDGISAQLLPGNGDISKVHKIKTTETVFSHKNAQCVTVEQRGTTTKGGSSAEYKDGSKFLTTLAKTLKSAQAHWQEKIEGLKKSKEGKPTEACPVLIPLTTLQDSTMNERGLGDASGNEPQKLTINPACVKQLSTPRDRILSKRVHKENQMLEEAMNERATSKQPANVNVNLNVNLNVTESESSLSRQSDNEDKKTYNPSIDDARATEKSESEDSPDWLENKGLEEAADYFNFKDEGKIENSENNTNVFDGY